MREGERRNGFRGLFANSFWVQPLAACKKRMKMFERWNPTLSDSVALPLSLRQASRSECKTPGVPLKCSICRSESELGFRAFSLLWLCRTHWMNPNFKFKPISNGPNNLAVTQLTLWCSVLGDEINWNQWVYRKHASSHELTAIGSPIDCKLLSNGCSIK